MSGDRGSDVVWSGAWVAERLGVELAGDEGLRELLGLALRRNPKRAHLLVSHVLGKHVPQRPSVVHGHGVALGRRVRELLGERAAGEAVVLGYAETATGLGHCVADGLGGAPYLHSTRRPVAGVAPAGGFEESHSHATSHLLLPEDPGLLGGDGPLVLVDDEFSTGNTVLNTVRLLHERFPRERYVVVALVDMRSEEDAGRLAAFAGEIGARVDLVAGASGRVLLPEGVLEKGRELVERFEGAGFSSPPPPLPFPSHRGSAPSTPPGATPPAPHGGSAPRTPEAMGGSAPGGGSGAVVPGPEGALPSGPPEGGVGGSAPGGGLGAGAPGPRGLGPRRGAWGVPPPVVVSGPVPRVLAGPRRGAWGVPPPVVVSGPVPRALAGALPPAPPKT